MLIKIKWWIWWEIWIYLSAASVCGLAMSWVIKHCLPFFSEAEPEWTVPKTTVEPQNTHLFSTMVIKLQQNKPILHSGWQASQNKPCVLWQKSVLLLSPVYLLESARKHNLLLHMGWNFTAVCDDDTRTTAITLHVWGTVQMCCGSLGVDKSDKLTFNTN